MFTKPMTKRLSIAIDEELKERIDEAADEEGVSTSELIRRSAEQYLDQGTLESRLSELEQRVDATEEGVSGLEQRVGEVEEQQSRGITDKVSEAFSRDRSPPG